MNRSTLNLFVLVVAGAGMAGFAQSLGTVRLEAIDPLILLLFIGLASATQRMPVFLFRSSAISVSFAAVIAAFVLYGTGVGIVVSLAQALVNAFTPRRKPLIKVVFNAGSLATSAFIASEVYRMVGGNVPPGDVPTTLIGVGLAACAYFVSNTALTAGVISISEGRAFAEVWKTNYSWMPLNFLATAVQGAALALASQALGVFGVIVFTLPLIVAWYSFRLYMSKSQEVRLRNEELHSVNEMLRRTNDRLEESHLSVIGALVGALEAKETQSISHGARTMFYSVRVAKQLALSEDEIAAIKLGALFHDVGKIGVPEHLLRKPSALTEKEWTEVRAHATIGAELLGGVPMLERIRPIVLSHHERYDGKGYPNGLRHDEIPLASQIISVADAYEAMTAPRPYRAAMRPKLALRELRAGAGTQFNPVVVEAFIGIVVGERRRARGKGAVDGREQEQKHVYQQALEAVRVTM